MPFPDAYISSPGQIADGVITSIKLASDLQSDNYVPGVSGWLIRRNTGEVEFGDGTFRGDLDGAGGTFDGDLSAAGGAVTITQEEGIRLIASDNAGQLFRFLRILRRDGITPLVHFGGWDAGADRWGFLRTFSHRMDLVVDNNGNPGTLYIGGGSDVGTNVEVAGELTMGAGWGSGPTGTWWEQPNGMLVQTHTLLVVAGGPTTWTFPRPFASTVGLGISGLPITTATRSVSVASRSTSQAVVHVGTPTGGTPADTNVLMTAIGRR